jgi:hypothetical protein
MTSGADITGISNEVYDLVSILYHSLEGAATYEAYVEDAEDSGDQELIDFFNEVQQKHDEIAQKAQQLLAKRIK